VRPRSAAPLRNIRRAFTPICLSKSSAAGTNIPLWPVRSRLAQRALKGRIVKFILVDQLISHEPGKRLVMAKNVTMAEEYLADHFPGFPVLPGVMMLEAAVQTAAWLVRQHSNFAHSLIVLKEARGVKYSSFVAPGQTLLMAADAIEITQTHSSFKIKGTVGTATAIQARLELAHVNLTQTDPALAPIDQLSINAQRERWQIFTQRQTPALAAPAPAQAAAG